MILTGGIGDWTASAWSPTNIDPLKQKGCPNGLDQAQLDAYEGHTVNLNAEYSRINFKMMQFDDPYMLMNYGEVKLLLAEASERGIGGQAAAAAQAHYEAGTRASMEMYTPFDATLTVTTAAEDAYLATYSYAAASSAQRLTMIGEQLWVNKFLNWWEAWADYRRTGIPALVPVNYPGNETGGIIPTRLKYPSYEVSGNPNFSAGSTSPNTYTTKVWWAGGPD